VLTTVTRGTAVLAAPMWGALVDHTHKHRPVVLVTLVVAAICEFLSFLVTFWCCSSPFE
jgi:Na+/melibiose symporter-like transporter